MRVLVTGGAGFIGSNLVRHYLTSQPDVEVRVLDDLSTGRIENLDGLPIEFTEGTILDYDLLRSVTNGVDSVVHLAALGSVPRSVAAPRPTHDANVTGTLNVLEAARETRVGHVVVASSSSVYGANPALPKSEFDWARPLSPYAATKLAAEGYASAYATSYGMKTLVFRFFNVFGPRQPPDHDYAAVIPSFLDAAFAGRPLTVHGDGLQSRDFTFVDTVCAVLLDATMRRFASPDPVNLAYGTSTTLRDLIALIETAMRRTLAVEHVATRSGDVRASQSDGKRVREFFPTVTPVPLESGIASTIEWFRARSET